MEKPIADPNTVKEVIKEEKSFILNYENEQKITLVRFHDQEKGLDGIIHDVFTDIPD
jgi:hypothetical protein